MTSKAVWTDENRNKLRKYYPHKTATEMKDILPQFTPRQMNRQAQYLGVKKKKEVKTRSRIEASLKARTDLWSDKEKQIILENYVEKGVFGVQRIIKEKLGKDKKPYNIKKIANRMGLTKKNQNSFYWEIASIEIYEENGEIILDANIKGGR